MNERPIIFSAPMVRAILENRKTQTRRIVSEKQFIGYPPHEIQFVGDEYFTTTGGLSFYLKSPYGKPGDSLWVREATIITPKHWDEGRTFTCLDSDGDKRWVQYLATSPNHDAARDYGLKITPSIFMPRWTSRITLEITDVKVQRLQEITEEDALAEGCEREFKGDGSDYGAALTTATENFAALWDSINAKRGFGWRSNPFTWVINFEVVKG